MAAKRKTAQATPEPVIETRSFEEIIADRLPKQPTTRERLAAAVDARAESRKKIEAQAKKQAKRKKDIDRIAARHHGRRTSKEFLRDVAAYDRAEAGR